MADHGFDGEELKYDADDSDLGEYEDVADVIARTKRRLRAQRAKQRAELQKALEENERRKVAREAEHQARLKRLEDFRRHVRKRNRVPPRIAKQIDPDSTLRKSPRSPRSEDCMIATPPPKPEGGRQRRVGPRTRQMRLRAAKRQAEARRRELQNDAASEEQQHAEALNEDTHSDVKAERQLQPEGYHERIQSNVKADEQLQDEAQREPSQKILPARARASRRKREKKERTLPVEERKADEQLQDEAQREPSQEILPARARASRRRGEKMERTLPVEEQEADEQLQDEAHREPSQEILLAQARVARRKREEMEQKLLVEEEQAQLKEEIDRRNAMARQIGHRRVLSYLKEKAEQEQSESEQRAAWLREHMEKKREKAAADAIKLPKMRAEAARRGMQWLSEEKQMKDKICLEEIAQRKARREKWQQYKTPKLIAKIKGSKGKRPGKSRAAVREEVACKVTGEPAATDSTDCPSDHDVQGQENRNPQMQINTTLRVEDIHKSQAIVANEAAHNVVGEAVAFIASEHCASEVLLPCAGVFDSTSPETDRS